MTEYTIIGNNGLFLQLEGPKATVFLIYQQNHDAVLATSSANSF